MRYLQKKGMALPTMVTIILTIVVFIITLPFLMQVTTYSIGYAKGGVCGASASLASWKAEYMCVDVAASPIELTCSRRHITVGQTSTKAIIDGKEDNLRLWDSENERYYRQYSQATPEVINTVFSQELLNCWEQFGSGELIHFNNDLGPEWMDTLESDRQYDLTACFVCSEIFFEEGVQVETNVQEALSHKAPNNDVSYLELLNNKQAICEQEIKEQGACWEGMEYYYTKPLSEVKEKFILSEVSAVVVGNEFQISDRYQEEKWTNVNREEVGLVDPLTSVTTDKGYAIVYMRKRFDYCSVVEDKTQSRISNFAYAIPLNQINNLCDKVVS